MEFTLKMIGTYVQKSTMFLYPLLNLPATIQPVNTYMFIQGFVMNDGYSMVCLLNRTSKTFQDDLNQMRRNKYFDINLTDDDFEIVIFDMSSLKDDYNKIYNGTYSELSREAAILITYHNRTKYPLAVVALRPDEHYQKMADILSTIPELIPNQLVTSPDNIKETLCFGEVMSKVIAEHYETVSF